MNKTHKIWMSAMSLLALTPALALANHNSIQGRTGLPKVTEGTGKVWMENGVVRLNVSGNSLMTTQTYRLHYPGAPEENNPRRITVQIREEYFRDKEGGESDVTASEAKGFRSFSVMVDGRRVDTMRSDWDINDKKDTATRWRSWSINFKPGQVHRMEIMTSAPLGENENRKFFQFASKDLRDWRSSPDRLEIRFSAPGTLESRMGGLEPKPNNVNSRAAQWVYTKERPRRDIYAQLPPNYGRMASRR